MLIGVDLGGTNVRAASIEGQTIKKIHAETLGDKYDLQDTLAQLIHLIRSVFDPTTLGIGVGVPSVVDVGRGIVYDVVNIPSWKEVRLKEILEKEFGVPVFVNNDVNCFVLGEKHFGEGKSYSHFIGVSIGTGIGSGLILNNTLISGPNCGAGEIAYLPYKEHHLEYYCSSEFFVRQNTSAYDAFLKAEENDGQALAMWSAFGHHVGVALKACLYAYDPEAIILGGSIAQAYPYFEKSMRKSLEDTYFPRSVEKLKIHISSLEHVAILGAAALVLEQ